MALVWELPLNQISWRLDRPVSPIARLGTSLGTAFSRSSLLFDTNSMYTCSNEKKIRWHNPTTTTYHLLL